MNTFPKSLQDQNLPVGKGPLLRAALVSALVAAAVACGGTAKPDATAKPADTAQGGDKHEMGPNGEMGQMGQMGQTGEMGEMTAMPPPVAKFHDTLAPRWHAAHGPQRMADTCAAIAQFHTEADAIVAAPAPSGANAAAWSDSGKQLAEAVTALDATCQAKDAAAFEPAFARVHMSFHHVMEAAGPHADEHGEHGEHGEHKM